MSESTNNSGENGNNNNNNTTTPRPWINFDPSWLVPPTGTTASRLTPTAITMLNDWMRAFPRPTTTDDTGGGNRSGGHNSHTTLNLGRALPSTSRPRSASNNNHRINGSNSSHLIPGESGGHASSTVTDGIDNSSIPNPNNQGYHLPASSSRSRTTEQSNPRSSTESYVVDMESDMNSWSPASNINLVPSPPHAHHHDHNQDEERGGRHTPGENSRDSEQTATTPADIFRQSPEGQAIISVAERYSPFLLILLIKGLFDHGSGIVCFLALLLTFSHANSLFKKEVAKQGKRKVLIMITVNLLVCMGLIFYVYQDENLYLGLLFLPTRTPITSMWTMFWVTGVVDFIAKFITIILKVFVLALIPARICPYQKRGKYYLFVERTSQLYRTSIPMYPWVIYMSGTSYEGPSTVVGGLLVLLYCALKLSDISKRYKAWRVAFYKMFQNNHYGESPSDLELKEAGVCPICHDTFQEPTKLTCNHIFCEECVTTWFDRERTCPMCRASIGDDPSFRDGQTTMFIQIF